MPVTAVFLHQAVGLPLLIVLVVLIVYSNVYLSWGVRSIYVISRSSKTDSENIMSQLQKKHPSLLPYGAAFLLNIFSLFFILRGNIDGIADSMLVLVTIPVGVMLTLGLYVVMHPRLVVIALALAYFGMPFLAYLLLK
jgi:hypothetical protein